MPVSTTTTTLGAVITTHTDQYGRTHRTDGPAITTVHPNGGIRLQWYIHGIPRHPSLGPSSHLVSSKGTVSMSWGPDGNSPRTRRLEVEPRSGGYWASSQDRDGAYPKGQPATVDSVFGKYVKIEWELPLAPDHGPIAMANYPSIVLRTNVPLPAA